MSELQTSQIAQNAAPAALNDNELKKHSQELGLMGKLFGSKEHAPINVAGLVIVLCLLAVIACPFLPTTATSTADMIKLFGSIALAALAFLGGYLGGRANS